MATYINLLKAKLKQPWNITATKHLHTWALTYTHMLVHTLSSKYILTTQGNLSLRKNENLWDLRVKWKTLFYFYSSFSSIKFSFIFFFFVASFIVVVTKLIVALHTTKFCCIFVKYSCIINIFLNENMPWKKMCWVGVIKKLMLGYYDPTNKGNLKLSKVVK